MVGFAPIVYLIIAWILGRTMAPKPEFNPFVLYMLLIVAGVLPGLFPIIRRSNLSVQKPRSMSYEAAAGLYTMLTIIVAALIEVGFILGLVCFLLSGELRNMLYFYPIGAAWALLRRPRRESFNQFLEEYGRAD